MPSTFQRHPTPDGVVTVGVDTHADVHVAAAVDGLGRLLGSTAIPTTVEGYAELLAWGGEFRPGRLLRGGGTGSWGAGGAAGQAVEAAGPQPGRGGPAVGAGRWRAGQCHRGDRGRAVGAGGPLARAGRRARAAGRTAGRAGPQGRPRPARPARGGHRDRRGAAGGRRGQPGRLVSEAAFAHLYGAAPLPASSGKTVPHRFNPGGHRDANEFSRRRRLRLGFVVGFVVVGPGGA